MLLSSNERSHATFILIVKNLTLAPQNNLLQRSLVPKTNCHFSNLLQAVFAKVRYSQIGVNLFAMRSLVSRCISYRLPASSEALTILFLAKGL